MSKIIRLVAAGIVTFAAGVALLPWAIYWTELGNVEGRPPLVTSIRSQDDINALWAENEPHLRQEELSHISPYWMYFWLGCATKLYSCELNEDFGGLSQMAGFVALTYLRDGHFIGNGMSRWHITGLCLTIWIQRTVTQTDLLNAYLEAKTHYRPKS